VEQIQFSIIKRLNNEEDKIKMKNIKNDIFNTNMSYDEILQIIEDNLVLHEEIDRKSLFDKMRNAGWKLNFSNMEEKYTRYHTLHRIL
jgi:hypothetical protein